MALDANPGSRLKYHLVDSRNLIIPRHLKAGLAMSMIDRLRSEQERILSALGEPEFRGVSEDVRRRIEALDLVASMVKELDDEVPAAPHLIAAENQLLLMLPEDARGETEGIEKEETSVQIRGAEPGSHGRGDERLTARKVLMAIELILRGASFYRYRGDENRARHYSAARWILC